MAEAIFKQPGLVKENENNQKFLKGTNDLTLNFCKALWISSLEEFNGVLSKAEQMHTSDVSLENSLSDAWEITKLLGCFVSYSVEKRILTILIDLRYRLSANQEVIDNNLNLELSDDSTVTRCDAREELMKCNSQTKSTRCRDKKRVRESSTSDFQESTPKETVRSSAVADPKQYLAFHTPMIDSAQSCQNSLDKHPKSAAKQEYNKAMKTGKGKVPILADVKERWARTLCEDLKMFCASCFPGTIDDNAIFRGCIVLQDIQEAKRRLKNTYDVLPWEEVEFLLARFISFSVWQTQMPLLEKLALDTDKIRQYLDEFKIALMDVLEDVKHLRKENNYPAAEKEKWLRRLGEGPRKNIEVCKISAAFEAGAQLSFLEKWKHVRTDYCLLRDVFSLREINHHINNVFEVLDSENENVLQLLQQKAYQVTGELVKNTWDSPRMSLDTGAEIMQVAPEYFRSTLKKARDKLASYSGPGTPVDFVEKELEKVQIALSKVLSHRIFTALLHYAEDRDVDFDEVIKEWKALLPMHERTTSLILKQDQHLKELLLLVEDEERDAAKDLEEAIADDTHTDLLHLDKAIYWDILLNKSAVRTLMNKLQDLKRKYLSRSRVLDTFSEVSKQIRLRAATNLVLSQVVLEAGSLKTISFPLGQPTPDKNKENSFSGLNHDLPRSVIDSLVLSGPGNGAGRGEEMDVVDKLHRWKDFSSPTLAALEQWVLYKANGWCHEGKSKAQQVRAVVEVASPVLFGTLLRNYLAHSGNTLIDGFLFSPSLEITILAEKLASGFRSESGAHQKSLPITKANERRNWLRKQVIEPKSKLFRAAQQGKLEDVKRHLYQGIPAAVRDFRGQTLLHVVAASGSRRGIDVLRLLVDAGVPVAAVDRMGRTALHVATTHGVARLLLEHNRTIACRQDGDGRTPLHSAALALWPDLVRLFVDEAGIDVNLPDKEGRTALHLAVGQTVSPDLAQRLSKVVQFLLQERGADTEVRSSELLRTALHEAAASGNEDAVRLLLAGHADVLAADKRGMTPLLLAAARGRAGVISALLELEGTRQLASVARGKMTALHIAARSGSAAVAEMLLKAAESWSLLADERQRTPLHYAAEFGHLEVVNMLQDFQTRLPNQQTQVDDDGLTPLHLASRNGHSNVVKALLQLQIKSQNAGPPQPPLADAPPPLILAATYGHQETIASFCEAAPLEILRCKDNKGITALHAASKEGHTSVVELLLRHGASPMTRDDLQRTSLHHASIKGQKSVIRALLKHVILQSGQRVDTEVTSSPHGQPERCAACSQVWVRPVSVEQSGPAHRAKNSPSLGCAVADLLNTTDNNSETAMHYAARGYGEALEVLLSHRGADALKEDCKGRTAASHAIKSASLHTLKILLKWESKRREATSEWTEATGGEEVGGTEGGVQAVCGKVAPAGGQAVDRKKAAGGSQAGCGSERASGGQAATPFTLALCGQPLHLAAYLGRVDMMELLISHGADVNAVDECGRDALEAAVGWHQDSARAVSLLLKHGAVPPFEHKRVDTASKALAVGKVDVAELLLKRFPDLCDAHNVKLMLSFVAGRGLISETKHPTLAATLKELDPVKQTDLGALMLKQATARVWPKQPKEKPYLIDGTTNISREDRARNNLWTAIMAQDIDEVEHHVLKGVRMDVVLKKPDVTPLDEALLQLNSELAILLIHALAEHPEINAEAKISGFFGAGGKPLTPLLTGPRPALNKTPLEWAVEFKRPQIVRSLLNVGVPPEGTLVDGSLIDYCAWSMAYDVVATDIADREETMDLLLKATSEYHQVSCEKVVNDLRGLGKVPVLCFLVAPRLPNAPRALRFLISRGCAPDGKRNSIGFTPLMIASKDGNVQCMEELLALHSDDTTRSRVQSADPFLIPHCPPNFSGSTSLHLAAQNGHATAVKLLLSVAPTLVHAADSSGLTPLETASICMPTTKGCLECCQLIFQALNPGVIMDQLDDLLCIIRICSLEYLLKGGYSNSEEMFLQTMHW
ncbi:uncharacterized protein LOC113212091 isoform X3 [Frankliniella occidentalis]|uniref:Uncharacterized protein LOC113212091 isoform X3 n=1 Tax=Frankliniella occidentalis TaxID=133901 RepID=A0A9C6U314_FRAOC|nr:uncharacterized protein LOC113212091 isoform X3 [Frankliniella occidentalis]